MASGSCASACSIPSSRRSSATSPAGLEEILVVEGEADPSWRPSSGHLYPLAERPRVVGKEDGEGGRLVPADGELTADRVAPILARRLAARLPSGALGGPPGAAGVSRGGRARAARHPQAVLLQRMPPHRSTKVPEGSVVGGGVGCHAMVLWMDRSAVGISHMGGEGAQWIGRAPFTDRVHMFQNIGDGTFFHSGSL